MAQRRENFLFLLRLFRDRSELQDLATPVLTGLPRGVSPLVFPVRVRGKRRGTLRRLLARDRVFCPVHWDLPPHVPGDRFPDAHALSRQILSLPIDQRYGHTHMQMIVEVIDAYH